MSRRKSGAAGLGIPNTTKDYKEILADPEIDAVLICSSTDTHSPISIEAIQAGKHVFCEKPIDHDVEKIKEVMKALEGKKTKYQVGFNRRFDHNFRAVKDAVVAEKWAIPILSRSHPEIRSPLQQNMWQYPVYVPGYDHP